MNRSDLEDIREFDESAVRFAGFGTFISSGAVWLFAEKAFEGWDDFRGTTLFSVCLLCIAVGGFLVYQGWRMHRRKASRIDRIFAETRPIDGSVGSSSAGFSSGTASNQGEQ